MRLISEYLRQNGALEQPQRTLVNTGDYRTTQIAIIQDMINGYEAIHAKNRWKTSSSKLSDDDWYKMYVSFEYMRKIINELKLLAPLMKDFNTLDIKKTALLKKTLTKDHLDWNQLLFEIYETLETKGDFFAYWNTAEQSKKDGIPILKVLETENITDIQMDKITNEVIAIVYKEQVYDEVLDEKNGVINKVNARVVTWIFKKGEIVVNDAVKYKDTGGVRRFVDKPEYKDIMRIIHVPSFKKQKDKFSRIPAIDYIDPVLLLGKIDTNRDIINDHLGFPFPFIIGGEIDTNRSLLIPGGSGVIRPADWALERDMMPEIVKMEINNDLQSIIDQKYDVVSDLYKKVALIREVLEEKMSGTDSSRNISQLRLGIEQKNKKYYENIASSFAPYFYVCLNENGLIAKKEKGEIRKFTFELPKVLINNSMFDTLLMTVQERSLGKSTLQNEMIKEGKTMEEIKAQKDLVTEELYGKNNDMSYAPQSKPAVADTVSNGNNLDNNFK